MKLRLKTKRLIALALSFASIGFLLLGRTAAFCTWIGASLLMVAIILNFTIRCPHCGKQLARKGWWVPNFCPRCGADVREE